MPGECLIVNLAAPFAVPALVDLYDDHLRDRPEPPPAPVPPPGPTSAPWSTEGRPYPGAVAETTCGDLVLLCNTNSPQDPEGQVVSATNGRSGPQQLGHLGRLDSRRLPEHEEKHGLAHQPLPVFAGRHGPPASRRHQCGGGAHRQ